MESANELRLGKKPGSAGVVPSHVALAQGGARQSNMVHICLKNAPFAGAS